MYAFVMSLVIASIFGVANLDATAAVSVTGEASSCVAIDVTGTNFTVFSSRVRF